MKIIILLLAVLAFVFFTALIDAEHYKKKQFVKDHGSRWIQRFMFFFVIAVFDIVGGVSAALIFTVFFDHILNTMRGLPLFYMGSVSKWDKFWKNNTLFFIATKLVLLVTAILLVYYAPSKLW